MLVSIFGLIQIWIAKQTLKINSKRDAALLSFQLGEKYMPKISSLYQKIGAQMIELKIDHLKLESIPIKNFNDQELKSLLKDQYDLIASNYSTLKVNFYKLLDELENFSLPFITKIADEEVAFNNECLNFLQKVRLAAYFIVKERAEMNLEIYYDNTTKLYAIWSERFEALKIDAQIGNLKETRSKIKPKKINPLGVK